MIVLNLTDYLIKTQAGSVRLKNDAIPSVEINMQTVQEKNSVIDIPESSHATNPVNSVAECLVPPAIDGSLSMEIESSTATEIRICSLNVDTASVSEIRVLEGDHVKMMKIILSKGDFLEI